MLIGAMNHPRHRVEDEIRWMGEMGLDFIDLTLEPPGASPSQIDIPSVARTLESYGMSVVGHTAYYLPLGHPFEEVRRGAVAELRNSLEVFARLGAAWMNIHPDSNAPMHDPSYWFQRNLLSMQELLPDAQRLGVGLMVENLPGKLNSVQQLAQLLEPLPEVGLHLDIGHTNLMVHQNSCESILAAYGRRLRHVHLHDNRGGSDDLHLPLGAGNLDLPAVLRALKGCGYDGTITLEVFTPDPEFVRYSRDKLRRMWESL